MIELETEILTITRDALAYIEQIKKMNVELGKTLGKETDDKGPYTNLIAKIQRLKTERDILKTNIEFIRQGKNVETAYTSCMTHIGTIQRLYNNMNNGIVRADSEIMQIRRYIIEEIKKLEHVEKDLEGLEWVITKYRGEMRKTLNALIWLLGVERRRIRKEEREASGFIKVLKKTIEHIDEISGSRSGLILSKINAAKSLGDSLTGKDYWNLRRSLDRRNHKGIIDFFEKYVKLMDKTCCHEDVEKAAKNMEELQEAIVRYIIGLNKKLYDFEAKHDENLKILNGLIKKAGLATV